MSKFLTLFGFLVYFGFGQLQAQCTVDTQVQNACGMELGAVTISVTGGEGPYLINDAFTIVADTLLENLAVGTYTLNVVGQSNCETSTNFTVEQFEAPIIENISIQNASQGCLGGFDADITGDILQIEIVGPNGFLSNNLPIEEVEAGEYVLTVLGTNACSKDTTIVIEEIPRLTVSFPVVTPYDLDCGGIGGSIQVEVTGGQPPYSYTWSNGESVANPISLFPGIYSLIVTDIYGCFTIGEVMIEQGSCYSIEGEVFLDANQNCEVEQEEIKIPELPLIVELVKDEVLDTDIIRLEVAASEALEGITYNLSYENDRYTLGFDISENRESEYGYLKISTPNTCQAAYFSIEDLQFEPSFESFQLLEQTPASECAAMAVDIGTPFLRRCFENTYYVQYCNYGAAAAEEAYLDIDFDASLKYLSSEIAAEDLGNNRYRFQLGQVAAGKCGRFTINLEETCESVLGQTHCTEAQIYPNAPCITPSDWSGAELRADARCEGEEVVLIIENVGNGDMPVAYSSIVAEEIVMKAMDTIFLNAFESKEYRFPANGSTYRIEVPQVENFPFDSQPSASIEGCGTNTQGTFSTGIVNLFSDSDYEPYLSVDCQENRGAYDPNDKQGLPLGLNEAHYILPNTDIEYRIRFQNTGTDTAFNVVILDTLSADLDWNSVQVGASSHKYDFDRLEGNVLRFHFRDILLVDSTTNEKASHGFVNFRISQKTEVELGSRIENTASIYFDYNEAIFTNTTFHTVEEDFIAIDTATVATKELEREIEVLAYPNPMTDVLFIEVKGIHKTALYFEVFDLLGKPIHYATFRQNHYTFQRGNLAEGMYLYKISTDRQVLTTGKFLISN